MYNLINVYCVTHDSNKKNNIALKREFLLCVTGLGLYSQFCLETA